MSSNAPQLNNGQAQTSVGKQRVWQSWGLSLLLHISLMAGLLILFWGVKQQTVELDRHGGIVLSIVDIADRPTDYLTEEAQQVLPELESAASEIPSAAQPAVPDQNQGDPGSQPFPMIDSAATATPADALGMASVADVSQMLNSMGGHGINQRSELSAEDLQRLEEEQALVAARKPRGEPVSLSVFGSERFSGRKFVFLLDQSNSMGSGGLGVLDASRSELDREIAKLLDYHEFQIVAYNDRTSMLGRRRLLPATAQNKRLVSGFVDGLVAVGGTEHRGGLMAALGLNPDVIVLISDGGDPALTDRDLSLVTSLAKGKTQIHCLQFGAGANPPDASDFMRKLADQNGGSFRYIDVSQWETNKN